MSAGDNMLSEVVDKAITATKDPVIDGVCKEHDSLRLGVNALLMCRRDDMDKKKKAAGFYIGNVGPFDRRDGYRLCLVAIIAYAVLVAYGKASLPGPDIFDRMPIASNGATHQ